MGVFYGLLAAVAFGSADFAMTRAARRLGVLRAFFWMQAIGLVMVSLAAVLVREPVPVAPVETWTVMLGAAAVNCVGIGVILGAALLVSL